MSYTKQTWVDGSDGGTPINADSLGHIEDGIFDLASQLSPADASTFLAATPFYIAHRGSGGEFPEHTMIAYQSAIAAGAQAIEVSVQVSSDGVLFCMHDTTLDRMTNSTWTGSNAAWTWAALNQQAKIVGTPLLGPGWGNQSIPTVQEVLDRFLGKVVIFLEAKTSAAIVPLQNLLTTYYPNANQSVVWKNYYTSGSFAWAKSHGFTTWGYMDTTTSSSALDAVETNIDMWGVPWEAADSQFTDVLSRATVKPVICWEVHRRSEVTRLTNLGVVGIMCAQWIYITHSTSTPILTADAFSRQVKSPGEIGMAHSDPLYALKWDTGVGNNVVYLNQVSGQGLGLGSMSCMTSGATGYRIQFDMMFPVLPASGLHAGLYFGQTDDAKHAFAAANATAAYRFLFRPVAGDMQLYTVAALATSGTQLSTDTTAALSATAWATFQIDVTTTSLILRRTDGAGWSRTVSNTAYRGLYWGLHNGSLTSLTTVARWRNMTVTQI